MGGFATGDIVGASDLKDPSLWKACVAEVLGTMFLVFIGCGGCIYGGSVAATSLAFGVAVATMAQAIGHVSGCHINPAVSVGMVAGGKMGLIKMGIYIGCQFFGAVLGAACLKFLLLPTSNKELLKQLDKLDEFPKYGKYVGALQSEDKLCWTVPNPEFDDEGNYKIEPMTRALGIEFLITMVLVLTVFGATDELRSDVKGSAPLAIGLSITVCHLFAAPVCGSSMNPARSFGSAIMAAKYYPWGVFGVYLIGPIGGGAAAGVLYHFVFRAKGAVNQTAEMPVASYVPSSVTTHGKPPGEIVEPGSEVIEASSEA